MAELINREDSNSPDVQAEREEIRKYTATLFNTKIFADVTFVVHGVGIRAHKNILSRYAYFQSMFGCWKEAERNEITILDIEPEIFIIILEFIYNGQLSGRQKKMENHAVDIIKAANMIGIDRLRNKCEKYIIHTKKMNVENACDMFIMADLHNAPRLKETALEFISMNLEEVKKTDGYIKFKRHRTSPADIVETLSPSKRPKLLH